MPTCRSSTSRRLRRSWLRVECLEGRWVPTTDLILDFDGGVLQSGQGYTVDPGWTNRTFSPFQGFVATSPAGPVPSRLEQIYQIVAGVRMDYADFDVNVIWDDRGVNSPFFDAKDTVVHVIGDTPAIINDFGLFGIASSVDDNQQTRDVALVFEPEHEDFFIQPMVEWRQMREIIDTCSHEAGHTFGLSHSSQADTEQRQLCTIATQDTNLDSRFSFQQLSHFGEVYAERDRLFQNLGAALPGKNLGVGEILTNQNTPFDTPIVTVDGQGVGLFGGSISFGATSVPLSLEYAGDRDAVRVSLTAGKSYAIRERAAGSGVAPVLTLRDPQGDYVATGSVGGPGGVSLLLFTPTVSGNYVICAGSQFDRTGSGVIGKPTLGAYHWEITPSWLEINSVAGGVTVIGSPLDDAISVSRNGASTPVTFNGTTVQVPSVYAKNVNITGQAGNDIVTLDLVGGAIAATINDPAGGDNLVVQGTPGNDIFTISSALVSSKAGTKITTLGLETITVNGLAGDDLFAITPGSALIRVNGGNPVPPAIPGDAMGLSVTDGVQMPINANDGKYVFPAAQPVEYTGMESFNAEIPAPPVLPKSSFATGSGASSLPLASLYRTGRDAPTYTVMAYDKAFRGGVRVATGDVDGDGVADLITAPGPGGGPHVIVFTGHGPLAILSFFAYDPGFTGGVWVAAGDFTGDGKADIVTGADAGGGSHVRIFNGQSGQLIREFFAYGAGFLGGVRVAAADVTGDGKADIITGAGPGGGPHVRVYDGSTFNVVREYFAYEATFHGGVYVSAGDVTGDGIADVVTGAGEGGGALVTARDGPSGALISRFFAYLPSAGPGSLVTGDNYWSSGVRVTLADADADGIAELYATPGRGRPSILKAFLTASSTEVWSRSASDPSYLGGMNIGS